MAFRRVALFGDSVLNNMAVVKNLEEDAVAGKLRSKFRELSAGEKFDIEVYAEPGKTMKDVRLVQTSKMDRNLSDICISMGGNDALDRVGKWKENRQSISGFFSLLAWVCLWGFEKEYRQTIAMLKTFLSPNCKIMVCNIYKPSEDYGYWLNKFYDTARWCMNSSIRNVAIEEKLILIDLNEIIKPEDLSESIEPNAKASEKIASEIFNASNPGSVKRTFGSYRD